MCRRSEEGHVQSCPAYLSVSLWSTKGFKGAHTRDLLNPNHSDTQGALNPPPRETWNLEKGNHRGGILLGLLRAMWHPNKGKPIKQNKHKPQ